MRVGLASLRVCSSSCGVRRYQTNRLQILRDGTREVLCVGATRDAHHSDGLVKSAIRDARPDAVAVQLCDVGVSSVREEGQEEEREEGMLWRMWNALSERLTSKGGEDMAAIMSFAQEVEHVWDALDGEEGGNTSAFVVAAREALRLRVPLVGVDEPGVAVRESLERMGVEQMFFVQAYADAWEEALLSERAPTSLPRATNAEEASSRAYARQMVSFMRTVNADATRVLIDDRAKGMVRRLRLIQDKPRIVLVCHLLHMDSLQEQWESQV